MSNNKNILFLREEYGNGQGTYIYPNGEKYVGDWKNGKYHGQGTFTYRDGSKYVGGWKNEKQDGQGTYTFPSGEKYVAEFKDGEVWNGTGYNKDGNIISKYVNGKLQ